MDKSKDSQLERPLLESTTGSIKSCDDLTSPEKSSEDIIYIKKMSHRWKAQAAFFLISLCNLIAGLFLIFFSSRQCATDSSTFSPALAEVGKFSQTVRFNGSLFFQSPYKGPITPEVTKAWDEIEYYGLYGLSPETVRKMGSSEDSVRFPPEYGGGYMAFLEVFHHIHCVRILWEGTYPDTQNGPSVKENPMYHQHLDHCADLLRQKLMCDGDLGMITYNWVKHLSHPTPNFNTVKKCRDFEAIKRWAVANTAVHNDKGFPKPDDAVELDDFP